MGVHPAVGGTGGAQMVYPRDELALTVSDRGGLDGPYPAAPPCWCGFSSADVNSSDAATMDR